MKLHRIVCVAAIGSVALFGGMTGCTKKPSQEEVSKLDDARAAAESAERKLAELRQERLKLEQDLSSKQNELQGAEAERNALKRK